MYGIYINLGCRFELRTQKLPYEKISGHFDDFIDLGHTVRVCKCYVPALALQADVLLY